MYSTTCPDCSGVFSRRDVMIRHRRNKHIDDKSSHAYPQSSEAYPPPPPPQGGVQPTPPPQGCVQPPPPPQRGEEPPQRGEEPPPPPPPQGGVQTPPPTLQELAAASEATVLQHPFTMMISGPTACGKTTFVKELLVHHNTRIQPRMQRIVWLYKRWQPMYTIIRATVIPKVEFIQGIPQELDDDDYFDPRQNNLLILDDMMSTAGKDKRITDLFTEGSHHRSLSIISINQNLYATKDPTQRRNCHYMILYDNPVDKSMTYALARQMFPNKTEYFVKLFEKATKRPYGYLFLDLKPFTPANQRLRYDIVWKDTYSEPIKDPQPEVIGHYSSGVQTDHVKERERESKQIKGHFSDQNRQFPVGVQTNHIVGDQHEVTQFENAMADNQNSCDSCGLLFDSSHDVQRHIKRGWCPEFNDEPPAKKRKLDEDTDNELDDGVEDNEGFLLLWRRAKAECKDKFDKIYQRFIDKGEDEEDATEMAENRIKPFEERAFLQKYSLFLEHYWLPLFANTNHNQIVGNITTLVKKGVSPSSAIRRILNKNKGIFVDLYDAEVSEDEDSDDDADEDTDDKENGEDLTSESESDEE